MDLEVAQMSTPRHSELGQSLVFSIVPAFIILCFAALLIDGASFMWEKRDIQGNADAAALAGAQEMLVSDAAAIDIAEEYSDGTGLNRSAKADDEVEAIANPADAPSNSVRVTIRRDVTGPFSAIFVPEGFDVEARATARIGQISAAAWDNILPLAAIEGTLDFTDPPTGQAITVPPGGIEEGHIGAIAPEISPPDCDQTSPNANDFETILAGSEIVCGAMVGDPLNTSTGARPNAIRDAFEARFGSTDGTHPDLFDDVLSPNPNGDGYIVELPESPRLGLVPIVSTDATIGDTDDDWADISGNSATVTVVDWVLVYIGRIGFGNEPAFVSGSDCTPTPCPGHQTVQIFITPIVASMSPNFDYDLREDWDEDSSAPIAVALID